MSYTPIPEGTLNWDVPVNAAFVDQDGRITTNAGNIATNTTAIATKQSFLVNNVKDHGAVGDGTTDDTTAIQNTINLGGRTYFPAGQYRVSTLTLPLGAYLYGVTGGGFGVEAPDSQQAHISQLAGTNANMIHVPVGSANIVMQDLYFDGNKNNNSSGDVIHIDDTGSPEELGMDLIRVHIEASAAAGIYVGNGRRALKAYHCQVLFAGTNGLRVNGSDSTWTSCLIGSSVGDNVQIGASVTRFIGCDVWGSGAAGFNILTSIQQVVIDSCGIDRNGTHGIFLGTSSNAIVIANNDFHSNSQNANGSGHHIFINTLNSGITIANNVVGTDSGITNACGYFAFFAVSNPGITMFGNQLLASSTNLGLTNNFATSGRPSPGRQGWFPATSKAMNLDRMTSQAGNVAAPWTSGTLYMAGGLIVPANMQVTQIAALFGSTAAVSPTHCWYALIDQSLVIRAVTSDNGSGTIPTSGSLALPLSATFSTPYDQAMYVGICIVAGTMPSPIATTGSGTILGINPAMCGNSTTSLTAPLAVGTSVTAITPTTNNPAVWII